MVFLSSCKHKINENPFDHSECYTYDDLLASGYEVIDGEHSIEVLGYPDTCFTPIFMFNREVNNKCLRKGFVYIINHTDFDNKEIAYDYCERNSLHMPDYSQLNQYLKQYNRMLEPVSVEYYTVELKMYDFKSKKLIKTKKINRDFTYDSTFKVKEELFFVD